MSNRCFRVHRPMFRHVVATMAMAMAMALVACGGGADGGAGDDAGGDEPAAGGDAQSIFLERGCAECHGEQGEGIGGDPETVVAGTNMIEQQFRVRIRNGRGAAMPGYSEEQISEEQLLLLYEWLKNP